MTKNFEDLSPDEIRYVMSLTCANAKDYLLKTHGEECFTGFLIRFVNCSIDNLMPEKIIQQNESIQKFQKDDQLKNKPYT